MGKDIVKEIDGEKYTFHTWTEGARMEYRIMVETLVGSIDRFKTENEELQAKLKSNTLTDDDIKKIKESEKKALELDRFIMKSTLRSHDIDALDSDVYDKLKPYAYEAIMGITEQKKTK